MRKLAALTAVLFALTVSSASAKPVAVGTLSVSGATVTATYANVPSRSTPEVTVQCSGYVDTVLAGTSPFTHTFAQDLTGCTVTLYYYTWQGQRETGVVALATSLP